MPAYKYIKYSGIVPACLVVSTQLHRHKQKVAGLFAAANGLLIGTL